MTTIPLLDIYIATCFVGVVLVWPFVRKARLNALRRIAWEQVSTDSSTSGKSWPLSKGDIAELGVYGGFIAAEYAWCWATIDPDVIHAAAFSSSPTINNGFQLVQFLHNHYDALSEVGKRGFADRLVGYVGEQQAASLLLAQGHVVQVAHTATQPVWDLLVDHHATNAKTITDIGSIKAEALAHGHVTYLVPDDAHGYAGGNIEVLHGFHQSAAESAVHHAIVTTHGETASHAIGAHLPWVTVAVTVGRNWHAVKQGRDVSVAVNHGVADTIGKGGGGVIGAKAGGALGAFFGPIGALIGAVVGGVGGALAGGAVAEEYKRKPLRQACDTLASTLNEYGSSFSHKLDEIARYIEAPAIRMKQALRRLESDAALRTRRPMWWIWPDFRTVLMQESTAVGRQQLEQQEAVSKKLLRILDNASQTSKYTEVGLIMMNTPEVSELIGDDASQRERVLRAREAVLYHRKQLNPAFAPPT